MAKKGKQYTKAKASIDRNRRYDIEEGLKLISEYSYAHFDESVDVAIRLGVDPRKAGRRRRHARI